MYILLVGKQFATANSIFSNFNANLPLKRVAHVVGEKTINGRLLWLNTLSVYASLSCTLRVISHEAIYRQTVPGKVIHIWMLTYFSWGSKDNVWKNDSRKIFCTLIGGSTNFILCIEMSKRVLSSFVWKSSFRIDKKDRQEQKS